MAQEHGQVKEERLDPEAELRRRLALGQIRQWGDPALRLRAHEVERFDDELRALLERMTLLMRDANGVGLAATQVGVLRRLFVFQTERDGEPQGIVNPRIVERSDETEVADEGCLSLQGVLVPVERHVGVVLEGSDAAGASSRFELEALGARVAQHELDHLDGILVLDRTTPEARRSALATLRPQPVLAPF